MTAAHGFAAVSGRVSAVPSLVLHEEILAPQFEAEVRDLLGWYRAVEKAIVAEQVRLGQVDPADGHRIAVLVDRLRERDLVAEPVGNSSDIAFAIEQHVRRGLPRPVPGWHVDRSRNDMQACAQVMFGRDRLLDVADGLLEQTYRAVVSEVGGEDPHLGTPSNASR